MSTCNSYEIDNNFILSSLLEDPYKLFGKNLDNSIPLFFHGTRKEIVENIHTEGFIVEPKRPVFSLDPVYSMGYCRKSESYLRGLIANDNKDKLNEEITLLLENKVITKEELADKDYMWWINKANTYYEKQSDIICDGSLLVFPWKDNQMIEAPESTIVFRKNNNLEELIEGAPSYWRTRQFYPNIDARVITKDYAEVELIESSVKSIKSLYSAVRKGKLNKDNFDNEFNMFPINLKVNYAGFEENKLRNCIVEQTIESSLLRELRDLMIGKLKSKGLKVYWNRNGNFLEDPRWSLTTEEIIDKTSNLLKNVYPNKIVTEFTKTKIQMIQNL